MSIHVSEPGRPVGTRLPEVFRSRRVGDVSELRESARINADYSEATDADFQSGVQAGKRKAMEQYGRSSAGEPIEQRAYLPVSTMCVSAVPSVSANATVAEALSAMQDNNTRHLAVMAEDTIAGMLDAHWLLAWANEFHTSTALQSLSGMELPAFLTASPETDAHQLARLMLAHQLDAALIINANGEPAGIVTSLDYLRLYADSGRYEGNV